MSAGRPRQFNPDDALKKALDLFWQLGYERAGMTELLQATGLARQSLYNTFTDKHTLYLKCLDLYVKSHLAEMERRLAAAGSSYDGLVEYVLAETKGSPWGCMVTNAATEFASSDDQVTSLVRRYWGDLERMVISALEKSIAEGDLPAGLPARRSAQMLCNALVGITVQRRAGRPQADMDAAAMAAIEGLPVNSGV